MLTANSVKNAIPVIFSNNDINYVFILALLAKLFSKSITPDICVSDMNNISIPVINDT